MKKVYSFFLIFCLQLSIVSQESTNEFVRNLPNPRSRNGSWILDQSKILENSGVQENLNSILDKLEKDTTNEIALVILPTIGNLVPKSLATELFQVWGIGKLGKDNGVLILHVLDQRRIEIETGYGMEGILSDVICKRLLEEKTIPYFKQGAFSTGHENLLRTIDQILRNKKESPSSILSTYKSKLPEPNQALVDSISEEILPFLDLEYESKKIWRLRSFYFLLCGLILIILYRFFLYQTTSYWKMKYESYNDRLSFFTPLSVFAYGITTILLTAGITSLVYSFFGKEYLIHTIFFSGVSIMVLTGRLVSKMYDKWEDFLVTAPRLCPKCKSKSFLIEDKNDIYRLLNEAERFEQKIRSFSFTIYECGTCKHLEKIKSQGTKFSTYTTCPKCNFLATSYNYRTLKEATYTQEGEEEKKKTCLKCGISSTEKTIIPKKSQSSYSTSSTNTDYSSPSTSSDSSPSSSSSSSSDDNFGGGSSGGGGAGSNY